MRGEQSQAIGSSIQSQISIQDGDPESDRFAARAIRKGHHATAPPNSTVVGQRRGE